MRDHDIRWTKPQMFKAIRAYQRGLGEIEEHIDDISAQFRDKKMPPEVLMLLDQILGSIVVTTVEVAQELEG
jgi:hypothetical protein